MGWSQIVIHDTDFLIVSRSDNGMESDSDVETDLMVVRESDSGMESDSDT